MAEKRDYYEVLGVDKNATADDIKSAYRKMALKWHPDRWVDGTDEEKKTAEEKFKEASEAYGVLSDPDKKARYDKFGMAGMSGQGAPDFSGGFGNLNDILNDLFGGGFGGFSGFGGFGGGRGQSGGRKVFRGRDIRTRVKLTLEEIATGCDKEVSLERDRACPDCGGRGAKDSKDVQTCPVCKGSGQEQRVVTSFFGQTVSYTTCSRCGGIGTVVNNPCRRCGGTGISRKREIVKVPIPAGVEGNMQLTVTGEGHTGRQGGTNGDLLIVVEEIPHKDLVRSGMDLQYTKIISVPDAILGTEVNVPCLDGNYKIKVEPGTQSGKVVRLRGRGLPALQGYGSGKGDCYVKFLVWMPKKVSSKDKSALEAMRKSGDFEPNPSREDRELFDKQKENF